MKKLIIVFLVLSQASGAFGSQLACRDLFASSVLDSANVNPQGDSSSLRAQLDQYQILSFKKPDGFFSRAKQNLGGQPPAPIEFNLLRFREKIEFYKSILSNSKNTTQTFSDLTPKNLEESLALMEAKNQLDPSADGVGLINKWLASASYKNVETMQKLLEFKNGESPAALYSQVARIYLLVHSDPRSFKDIFNLNMNPEAEKMIAKRAMISFLTKSYEDAFEELGISRASGVKSILRNTRERFPNAANYGFNLALGAAEVAVIGMPIFANLREISVLKDPIANVTDQQRLQIIQKDFSGLDLLLQKRLMRAAKAEIIWTRFLRVLGMAGMVYMVYVIQEKVRHDFFSTSNKVDREKLEDEAFEIYMASQVVNHMPKPDADDIIDVKADIKSRSDGDLERQVQQSSRLVGQAKQMTSTLNREANQSESEN